MKNILPVFVVLLFLGVASTAFAQVGCNVSSTPVSRDTLTGLTEPAGDITFACTQSGGAGSAAATITVDYQGAPITNSTAYPAAKPISITPVQTSVGGAACAQPTIGATGVSNATGQVVITVLAEAPGAGFSCSFTLTGVLLGLSGTGKTSDVATLSVSPGTPALSITAGQNTPTVVTSVLDGVVQAGVKGPTTPALVLTSGTVLTATSSAITVKENYIDMFKAAAQFNGGASTQGVQLLFTFTGVPSGSTLTCLAPTVDNGGAATVFPVSGAVTSASPTLFVEISGANQNTIDTLSLTCSFATGTATIPLASGSITATVTLAPTGTAFSSTGAVLTAPTTGQIPRYTVNTLTLGTIVNIISATTHMLIPYATVQPGFDTGIVIANTSNDPYGFSAATGGARSIGGPVTLVFFPVGGGTTAAGTPFCVASGAGAAGTTGGPAVNGITACTVVSLTGRGTTGLSTGGVVGAGSSWVFLGSEMMSQIGATAPTSFIGYIFAIANFPYAHPTAYVVDAAFSGKFTSGGPALVLPNPSVVSRTANLGAGLVESLGH